MQRQDKLESYMDEVHANQLKQDERNQVAQAEIHKTMKNTDSKMEVVVNIE